MNLNIKDKSIKQLHDTAMGLVSDILYNPLDKDHTDEEKTLEMALKFETAAADKVSKEKEFEPSRSILYRSAATIAIRCRKYKEAIRLANEGLSGFPPVEIKKELEEAASVAKGYVK